MVWQLGQPTAAMLPTINDLALGPDGRVYILNAHTQVIARMEQRLTLGNGKAQPPPGRSPPISPMAATRGPRA